MGSQGLYGILQLFQGCHLDSFPLKSQTWLGSFSLSNISVEMFTFSILSILETRPSPLTFLQVRSTFQCFMVYDEKDVTHRNHFSYLQRGILFSVVNRIQPVTLIFCEILNLSYTNIVCVRAAMLLLFCLEEIWKFSNGLDTKAPFSSLFSSNGICYLLLALSNTPRSLYQYSNVAPRLLGQTSIFGVVFFVFKFKSRGVCSLSFTAELSVLDWN